MEENYFEKSDGQSIEATESPDHTSQKRDIRVQQITTILELLKQKGERGDGGRSESTEKLIADIEKKLGKKIPKESANKIYEKEDAQNAQIAETVRNLERLKKVASILSPDDFLYLEKILGNISGSSEKIFPLSGLLLHTTTDHALQSILKEGALRQEVTMADGTKKNGAYFTDADFSEALTFHTIWDDANCNDAIKKISSEKYFDQIESLARYCWSTEDLQRETKEYISRLSNDEVNVSSAHDVADFFQQMKNTIRSHEIPGDPEKTSQIFGITLAFHKNDLPEQTKEGTVGLQRLWERRVYSPDGVSLKNVRVIFAPEARIAKVKEILKGTTLEGVKIRPSEELEIARILQEVEKQP